MTATGAIVAGDVWARCVPARDPKTIMIGLLSKLADGAMMAIPVDQGLDAVRAIWKAYRLANITPNITMIGAKERYVKLLLQQASQLDELDRCWWAMSKSEQDEVDRELSGFLQCR